LELLKLSSNVNECKPPPLAGLRRRRRRHVIIRAPHESRGLRQQRPRQRAADEVRAGALRVVAAQVELESKF